MEIYAYKCKKCGHLHYPYRMVCKNCGKNEHNEFDQVPLTSMKILGQLNIPDPKIGMKVTGEVAIVRRDDYNEYYGMIFSKA